MAAVLAEHERAIHYLLQKEAKLSAKCEDLESRAKRNNLRIYGVKEGEESNDMIKFISNLMRTSLELPEDLASWVFGSWFSFDCIYKFFLSVSVLSVQCLFIS